MNTITKFFWGIIIVLLSACTGGRHIETTSTGENAFKQGDFQNALLQAEKFISQSSVTGNPVPGEVYSIAGISAYELEDYNKSIQYLELARQENFYDEQMYICLARNYQRIDNLSKEITALETYLVKFPEGNKIKQVRERLFQTCLESESFEQAEELWSVMDSTSREDVRNLETWLELNRMVENKSACDSLAKLILEKDPESESGLKWEAESYFWKAENVYLYQMKAYKENRTRKQYSILLKAFKQVNADFRQSRDYFLKLYEINPDPEYARYLGNIFTRLEDETKADYYKKLSN